MPNARATVLYEAVEVNKHSNFFANLQIPVVSVTIEIMYPL